MGIDEFFFRRKSAPLAPKLFFRRALMNAPFDFSGRLFDVYADLEAIPTCLVDHPCGVGIRHAFCFSFADTCPYRRRNPDESGDDDIESLTPALRRRLD